MIGRLLALLACLTGAALAKPRVASINMCTDQLVLALADDDQILGLSHLARDPDLSFYRQRALRFPRLSGQAEDVLPLRPDIVFTASFAKAETRGLLSRAGLRVETFDNAATIAAAQQQIARMGTLLGQEARAAAANAQIDAALARLAARPEGPRLSVLPLERRGWVTGRDSLISDLLARAGMLNAGAAAAPLGRRLPLETIVTLTPDRLLLTAPPGSAEDQGTALLHHPALRRRMPASPLVIPERLTVCAGPMLIEALDRLAGREER